MKPNANARAWDPGAAEKSSEIVTKHHLEDTRSIPKFQDLALVVSLEKYVTRQIALRRYGRAI